MENFEIMLDEINWRVVVKDILRHALLIVLSAAIAFMGIGIYNNIFYKPEYTSTATLAVIVRDSADTNTYYSLTTANEIAQVYASVFTQDVTKEKIAEVTGKLPKNVKITAQVNGDTNLMNLSATGSNPKEAFLMLQSILANYQIVSDYVFSNAVIEVILNPQVPVSPSNAPIGGRVRQLAVLGAMALMACVVAAMAVLRKTVKTPKAAKRRLEGECLTVFGREIKNKTLKAKLRKTNKGILLTSPLTSFKYEENCHQLASRLDYQLKKKGLKTLAVTSVAENEGKSTIAVNLAIALARRNKRVLLLDMDLKKPAVHRLLECQVPDDHNVLSYFHGRIKLDDIFLYHKKSGLYVGLNKKGVADSSKYIGGKLDELLNTCKDYFDYVILDTAPISAGADTEALCEYADASALVIKQDTVTAADLNDSIETLSGGKSEFFGYILNGFDGENTIGRGYGYGYGYGYGNYRKNNKE